MSLRSKIVLILSVVVVLYVGVDNGIQRLVVSRSFVELEEGAARDDLERAQEAIGAEVAGLDAQCRGFARDDGMYAFVSGDDPGYAARGLDGRDLDGLDLDLLFVLDAEGIVLWSRAEDPRTRESLSLRDFPRGQFGAGNRLLRGEALGDDLSGLIVTDGRAMLVSMQPVVGGGGDRAPIGRVLCGRFVDAGLEELLAARTGVTVRVAPLVESEVDAFEREHFDELSSAIEPQVYRPAGEDLRAYLPIHDIGGRPEVLLGVTRSPEITLRGESAVDYALLSTIGTALLILLVLLKLLQAIVVSPLSRLTEHAVMVGRTDDMTKKVALDREDELGQLATELDRMMDKLAQSRSQLAKTARLAGMSEIATGVLHNVGNVLNSVNVSASVVGHKVRGMPVGDLEQMNAILQENAADLASFVRDDPRGKHLLPFVAELASGLRRERDGVLAELTGLERGIEHIVELVRSQQTYAGAKGAFEATDLAKQVDQALEICRQSYGWSDDVEVVREYGDVGSVWVDRNKLMEILVNLIQNARQAMDEYGPEVKRLTLRVREVDGEQVRVEVQDSGKGIAPENLARVFQHGFTTRDEGHGFGLHTAANAATEMDGHLDCTSEGAGHGALFHLTLPTRRHEAARAA